MDVFSSVLSSSTFARYITNLYDPSNLADIKHFLIAIKPDLFMLLQELREQIQYFYSRVTKSEKISSVERILLPGEIKQLT